LPQQSTIRRITGRARMSTGRVAAGLGFSGLPLQIYLMLLITLIYSLGRNLAFPYLAIYLTSGAASGGLAIDPSVVGLTLMVGGLSSIAALLVSGSLCDRIGRKKMLLAFLYPTIFITLSFGFITAPEQIIVVYALMGVVGSFYDPAFMAMVADLIPPARREEVYGQAYMVGNVGTVVGPLIGGALLETLSYPSLFMITAIFVVAASVITTIKIKETNPVRSIAQPVSGRFSGIPRDRLFITFCLLSAMTSIVYTQLYGLLSVYTEYLGLPAYQFGILFSLNGAMVVLLQIPIRKYAMRIGSTSSFILAQTLYSIGFSLFFFSRDLSLLLLGDVVLTLGEITFVPASNGFIANLAPMDKRGRYMAFAGLFSGLGSSVGSFIGFGFYGLLPHKEQVWALLGGIGALTVPGYALLHRKAEQRRSQLPPEH